MFYSRLPWVMKPTSLHIQFTQSTLGGMLAHGLKEEWRHLGHNKTRTIPLLGMFLHYLYNTILALNMKIRF